MKRRGKPALLWSALLLTLIGIAPMVSVLIASGLAGHFGCRVDEGSVHPCSAFGTDIGELLYTLGVMGWLMLLTIWPLLLAPLLWIGWFVTWLRSGRAATAAGSPETIPPP